jgi:hypothetical protein
VEAFGLLNRVLTLKQQDLQDSRRAWHTNSARSELQTDERFPSLGSQSPGMKQNADGSYDIYFGPKAPVDNESNWVQDRSGQRLVHHPTHLRPALTMVR